MSIYLHKSHNVSVLLYHLVFPAKYRRVVFNKEVDECIKTICLEIAKRYEIHFLEIGTDKDHVHFLVQSVPMYRPQEIVQKIKSITGRKVFEQVPDVKQKLWGGQFWTKGYFVNTVGRSNSEKAVLEYVRSQGKEKEYVKIHTDQLVLF
jgi:putative transposase